MITKTQAIFAIIGLLIFAGLAWLADWGSRNECPRMILGYNCRGKTCDHSEEERDKALWAMRR